MNFVVLYCNKNQYEMFEEFSFKYSESDFSKVDILIFDEATNALDVQTEKKIINEIFSVKEDKTIIFVSHNPDNLVFCDLIYEVKGKTLLQKNLK